MAKYLKENEIKAGMTVYIVHPEFNWIEKAFITKRPHMHFDKILGRKIGLIFNYNESYFNVVNGKAVKDFSSNIAWKMNYHNYYYYLGDAGVPNKHGVFSYKQQRRVFRKLSAAVKYWNDKQNCPKFLRHLEEKADWETFGDLFWEDEDGY